MTGNNTAAIDPWVEVAPDALPEIAVYLRDEPDLRFDYLSCITVVDYFEPDAKKAAKAGFEPHLEVVYHLWSATTPDWLRVIADGLLRDDPRVPSVTFMWKGAEWMEREAYDMFGITFEGNRDLRRIYMPPDYQSFPLRKDFFLPDDAARSPGAGVRPMERTHTPRNAPATATVRRAGA